MNVAIISPEQNAYSETFIQAHKQIDAKVFFYYGGYIPNNLEGYGQIEPKSGTLNRWYRKLNRRLTKETLPVSEIELIKSFKTNRIDVVFAEYGPTGAEMVHICERANLPLVTIFHGYDASEIEIIKLYQTKYRELFHYASKIIVVSEVMKTKLISLGCLPQKIIKSIYGPNEKFTTIIPTFSEAHSFISVGRFVNKKAPYYTLLVIKKVAETFPDVKLYFAGDGPLYESINNLVRYFELSNNIVLLGVITQNQYITLLEKVSGYIQHSVTAINGDMEGTPVSILEASAAGIPVISTRHAGIPEVIIDTETGLLVDEHEVDKMAEYIIKLIQNKDLSIKMGLKGKENINNNFSLSKHLKTVEKLLQDAIAR